MAGIRFFPDPMIQGFGHFAAGIRFLTTVGLIAGAVEYMTGFRILKGLAPITEAMAVVSSIGVVLLPSCGGDPAANPGKTAELDRRQDRDEWKQCGRTSHGDRQPGPYECASDLFLLKRIFILCVFKFVSFQGFKRILNPKSFYHVPYVDAALHKKQPLY